MPAIGFPCPAIPYVALLATSRIDVRSQLLGCAITMASRLSTPQGYSALAELFALYPNLGVFRLFKDLNAGNLVDLQAELVHLRTDLQFYMYNQEDWSRCPEGDHRTATIYHLKGCDSQSCPYHARIWRKKLEIRQKLEEYSMCQPLDARPMHTFSVLKPP